MFGNRVVAEFEISTREGTEPLSSQGRISDKANIGGVIKKKGATASRAFLRSLTHL